MLSVRLDSNMKRQLENLAKTTQRPKSFFVKEALKSYLDDMDDFYNAQKRSKFDDKNFISIEELEKSLSI